MVTANDTLDGESGNDTLIGGTGNDTYKFGITSGQDTINNVDGGTDNIMFGAEVAPSMLAFDKVGNHLQISIAGTSDTLTVSNWYSGYPYPVGFQFASGATVLPFVNGTSGNDTLSGGSGSNVVFMFGGAGDDSYTIDSLNDIVAEVSGDGSDTVAVDVNNYVMANNVETAYLASAAGRTLTGNISATHLRAQRQRYNLRSCRRRPHLRLRQHRLGGRRIG